MKQKLLLFISILFAINMYSQSTCATAVNLTASGTYVTTTNLTGTYIASCMSSSTGIKAYWYKFTPSQNGEVHITSDLATNTGTTYTDDTRISIMKGTCTSLVCVDYNDDISDTNYFSEVTFPVESGTTYYIQWDSRWNAKKINFEFTFTASDCVRPGSLDFYLPDNYTTTSVDLFWNQAIGSPANYNVDWSTDFNLAAGSGTLVPTATLVSGTTPYATASIENAPISSNLRYYVRSDCGTTQSGWQGPYYAYLAKTLPYTTTFEDANLNYKDGFVGFSLISTDDTSNPANYADGGAGYSVYTYNSTTATSNTWAYSRAISLQAGEVVTISFKTRLFSTSTAATMTFDLTSGSSQSSTDQTNVISSFSNSSDASYTTHTATFTAPTSDIYYFGFHNNSPAGTQTYLFFDTLTLTSILGNNELSSDSFAIYPNPSKDLIQFKSINEQFNSINVQISDLNGRIVKSFDTEENQFTISIGDLVSGIYFAKVSTDKGTFTQKIIKE